MKWHAKQRSLRVCQMLSLLPRQILRMSLLIWQVFNGSFGDGYLLLQVPVIIMIIHVENVNAFHRLKIIHWGSAVKCCVFGLWITIAGPRYDGHMVIQEVISSISKMFGAICSLQRSVTLQKQTKHIPSCRYPMLTRVLSFYRLYWPNHQPECTLPKGGKL